MQKKFIALAVAGLVSGAAFAQSNVTVYGIVDAGYSYRGDNMTAGVGSRSGFDNGQQSGTRLGFKGTEDLGNGLSALFVLETGIATDNGGYTQGNLAFGRQSYVGLSSKTAGTVTIGRQYSPQFNLIADTDPFAYGTVGQATNVYATTPRLNNLAAYTSPSFGGLTVVAGYSFAVNQNESVDNLATAGAADVKAWALSPVYKNGPLMVGANLHRTTNQVTKFDTTTYDLAATYDLKVVKLAAAFGRDNPDGASNNTNKFMLGLTAPVSAAGAVLASYNRATTDKAVGSDARSSQWALGYQHNLSKRTNVYAVYADISNKNGAVASVGDATSGGMGYQNGLSLGVRHKF